MRDFSADHRWLSLNTATVRKQGHRAVEVRPALLQAVLLEQEAPVVVVQERVGERAFVPLQPVAVGDLRAFGLAQRLEAEGQVVLGACVRGT
jgi:hypothetical protein